MRFRLANKIYAGIMGYFWLACPSCGKMFGGHEWGNSKYMSIPMDDGRGQGICPDCENQWSTTGRLPL